MRVIDENTIQLDRELSDLDLFVLDFVKVLERHTIYCIVSGYVALLFGRSRNTEDVDLFIPRLTKDQFQMLYHDLNQNGFEPVMVHNEEELFSMLTDRLAVRFARKGNSIPNMELKFIRDIVDGISLQSRVKVITRGGNIYISSLEMQIAYKKLILKSPKDLEDARHLQGLFSISEENINKYKELFTKNGRL